MMLQCGAFNGGGSFVAWRGVTCVFLPGLGPYPEFERWHWGLRTHVCADGWRLYNLCLGRWLTVIWTGGAA